MAGKKAPYTNTTEHKRLEDNRDGTADWRLWGPYLSERAWGTVREDYSAYGDAWDFFPHDHARSRAYRWSEDGLGGLSDKDQNLCFALAIWNGRDPYLKERAFGLTGPQGNHGEDVKEYYFYLEGTPSHSYLGYLYKYPQVTFPYDWLVEENSRRDRHTPGFNLVDTGAFDDDRYFDVAAEYSKSSPTEIHIRVTVTNRGPETHDLHLLPTLWFRNTWSWGGSDPIPSIKTIKTPNGAAWAVAAESQGLGTYRFYGSDAAELLFTDNETNYERLHEGRNASPYVKDGFHSRVVNGDTNAVNPAGTGTKFAGWYQMSLAPGESRTIDLVLSAEELANPFANTETVHTARQSEADEFFKAILPDGSPEDRAIVRQACAGMMWCKQYFHYDVERWLTGDVVPPPDSRWHGRNHTWKHMRAADIISMPDDWEYPWFAAWDLAFHCATFAMFDVDFAKDQLELMLGERYLHPNGQIPAYEWSFGDVNPPVHAMGALKAYRAERVQRGEADHGFLKRVFHKLLLNYAWWINRKDADGSNVFEGGFMGLDNISVFDRSEQLPPGYSLKQADATGWVAMFALNMTVIALELCEEDPTYEEMAIQAFEQFLAIADAIGGHVHGGVSLWDPDAGFFKDQIVTPDGQFHRIDVYSMVGLIPLFATEIIDQRLLSHAPRFKETLVSHGGGLFQGHTICACPEHENERGEHLLSLVDHTMLPPILTRLLNEAEFLSPYGVRSVSRIHAERRDLGTLPGVGKALIEYVPGESNSPLFGGNSNWRGPVWLPVNFALVQAIEKFYRYLGDSFTVPVPCLGGKSLNLNEIATLIAERLVDLYRPAKDGHRPAMEPLRHFANDPHWHGCLLFYEYFHADTGSGLGAAHQTGWTGLLANLVMRRYRRDIPTYWREHTAQKQAAE